MTRDLYDEPEVRSSDTVAPRDLSLLMRSCQLTLSKLGQEADLNSSVDLLHMQRRLDKLLKQKWVDYQMELVNWGLKPNFPDLLKFVERRGTVMSTEYGQAASEPGRNRSHE